MDLIATLKRPEGKTLEFKRDLSSPLGIVCTVVAFANTAGGVLLIGVEDKTGFVRGVADVLAAEERLADILADTVAPQVMPDIEVLPWRDRHVLAAEVFPSPRRPHGVRAEGRNGVYVRVDSTNRRADPALVDEIRRFANRQGATRSRWRSCSLKQSTSEQLPSVLHPSASSGEPTWTLWAW